jgi:hypothetical protein
MKQVNRFFLETTSVQGTETRGKPPRHMSMLIADLHRRLEGLSATTVSEIRLAIIWGVAVVAIVMLWALFTPLVQNVSHA